MTWVVLCLGAAYVLFVAITRDAELCNLTFPVLAFALVLAIREFRG